MAQDGVGSSRAEFVVHGNVPVAANGQSLEVRAFCHLFNLG